MKSILCHYEKMSNDDFNKLTWDEINTRLSLIATDQANKDISALIGKVKKAELKRAYRKSIDSFYESFNKKHFVKSGLTVNRG